MENPEDGKKRQEIQVDLGSIAEASRKCLVQIKRRDFRARLASAFVISVLVFVAGAAVFVALVGHEFTEAYVSQNQLLIVEWILSDGLVSFVSGSAAYILLGRKYGPRLKEISSLVTRIGGRAEDNKASNSGIVGDALLLSEKIMAALQEMVKHRGQDSFIFGAVAFIIVDALGVGPLVSLAVGALVWLFFWYRKGKAYKREIALFEKQQSTFQSQMKDILDHL